MSRILNVYDTMKKKIVEVEVSEEVYKAYTKTGWNIKKNNQAFFEKNIQFSQLIGGNEGAFENFREFRTEDTTSEYLEKKGLEKRISEALEILNPTDKQIIKYIFFENKTEEECAKIVHINQGNVHKRKKRALYKMEKFLSDD